MRVVLFALVALLFASSLGVQAQPAPAMDYARLLQTQFYPSQGRFSFIASPRDVMVFPPADGGASAEMAYLVRDDQGTVLARQIISRVERSRQSPTFAQVTTQGALQEMGGLQDGGRYTIDVVMDETVVSRIPFTASFATSDDPFNPWTRWTLDGPWRTHAFFEHQAESVNRGFSFTAWVAADEAPPGAETEVSIRLDGEEVAWGHTAFSPGRSSGWGPMEYDLMKPVSRGAKFASYGRVRERFMYEDMTGVQGTYEIMLSSEAGPFRTFSVEVGPEGIVPHPRSDLRADRTTFLTPRRVREAGTPISHVYWIVNEE